MHVCCPTLCDPIDCSPPGSSVWNFLGKNTGVSCHFLLKEIFPTQGSNPRLCISCFGKQVLYHSATWETQVLTRVHHNSSGWRGQGWGRSERVYSLFLLKIPKPADPKVFLAIGRKCLLVQNDRHIFQEMKERLL